MNRILILPATGYRTMPWKNGSGSTTEIAVSPEGADLADFDWRISMARVDGAGPFSIFPGIDRTLCLLDGEGLVLDGLALDAVTLTTASAPFSFPADVAVHGTPLGGPITDLNVMTRRGRAAHVVTRLHADTPDATIEAGDLTIVVALSAVSLASVADGRITLGARDALRIDGVASLRLAKGEVYVIQVRFHR